MQLTNLTPEIITEINVPKQMIRIQEDNIRIFALDARTIGLSNAPPEF
ncbi:MAG TPA: hypothetical protein VKK79_25530 [Candidatus Lokiarchaeia archaeon]|nr:hypothetical protein [Candidatus Lokiarchaeia archaeon]